MTSNASSIQPSEAAISARFAARSASRQKLNISVSAAAGRFHSQPIARPQTHLDFAGKYFLAAISDQSVFAGRPRRSTLNTVRLPKPALGQQRDTRVRQDF